MKKFIASLRNLIQIDDSDRFYLLALFSATIHLSLSFYVAQYFPIIAFILVVTLLSTALYFHRWMNCPSDTFKRYKELENRLNEEIHKLYIRTLEGRIEHLEHQLKAKEEI